VGLFDPDPQTALRGALFLGISARQKASQLNPPESPLQVALLARPEAALELARLDAPGLLVLSLFPSRLEMAGASHCRAIALDPGTLESSAIAASIPPLTFRLEGSTAARREGYEYLQSLSPCFRFLGVYG
jgi:hypothetical protein